MKDTPDLLYLQENYTKVVHALNIGYTKKHQMEVKLLDIPTRTMAYRMVKIDFNDLPEADSIKVYQRYRNVRLTWYQSTMSLIFFVATVVNAAFYLQKLKSSERHNLSEVKRFIAFGLIALIMFNLPYKLNLH